MDLCGLRSSPISLIIIVSIMLQVLPKRSYFRMECCDSANQLVSETLISVFMKRADWQETPRVHPPRIMVRNAEAGHLLLRRWKAAPSPRPLSHWSHRPPTATPPLTSTLTKTGFGRHNSASDFNYTFQWATSRTENIGSKPHSAVAFSLFYFKSWPVTGIYILHGTFESKAHLHSTVSLHFWENE